MTDADEAIMSDEYNAPERVSDDCDLSAHHIECPLPSHKVNVIQSPVLNTLYQHHPVALTLDTGATTNLIHASAAEAYNLPIHPASQMAWQANGVPHLMPSERFTATCREGAKSSDLMLQLSSNLTWECLLAIHF